MRWNIFHLLLLSGLMVFAPGQAQAHDAELADIFAAEGVTGTLVIAPLQNEHIFVHNELRAGQRFPVASTFKILNSLIALEDKVITADDTFIWDGLIHDIPNWNRDHTLESAFQASCVWCYQELARRIGAERYKRLLASLGYGELREPFELTTFWLDGSLRMSALEQIGLLQQIYQRELPFADSSYDTLRRIMLAEQTPAYSLRAKTGWATQSDPGIGWYVGYVETDRSVWFFALNIDIQAAAALPLRQKIVRAALRAKQIIE